MRSFRLTKEEIEMMAARHETPFLVISLAQVEENYRFFRRHLPRVNVYYAMKANPAPRILTLLASLGAGFDTASAGEMETLAAMGVPPERMIYANPVKTPDGLRAAAGIGVVRMTFDESQLKGIAAATGAMYFPVNDRDSLAKALEEIGQLETTKLDADAYDRWDEHFAAFLLAGSVLVFLAASLSMAASRRLA